MIYSKIRSYCEKIGISIKQLEELCHISNGTIGKWNEDREEAKSFNPSWSTLQKLAKGTGIPITEWLKEDE